MTAEFPLAVHALVYLMHTGRVTSSRELADNICTNPARVRKVMTKLHNAGLVESTRGQGSGYLFCKNGELTLQEVLKALEQVAISMSWRSGDMDTDCLVSSGMGAVMDSLYEQLNSACQSKLAQVTIRNISEQIWGREGNDYE